MLESHIPFFAQWQFWFAIINLGGLIILFLFNKFSHDKVVNNDLHHISNDIKTIIRDSAEASWFKGTIMIFKKII